MIELTNCWTNMNIPIKQTRIIVGINWGVVPEKGWFGATGFRGVDLDMGCVEIDKQGNLISKLSWEKKETAWGKMSKDDMEGDIHGNDQLDNEWIEINLNNLPEENQLLLTISNYTEQNLKEISHFDYRIYSGKPNNVFERFYYHDVKESGIENNSKGFFLGVLKKLDGQWHFHAKNIQLKDCELTEQYTIIKEKHLQPQ